MRYYDRQTGRWTQQDPLDQAGDLREGNRYAYVGGDPINATDPSGRFFVDINVSSGYFTGGIRVGKGGLHFYGGAGGGIRESASFSASGGAIKKGFSHSGGGCLGVEVSACASQDSRTGLSGGVGSGAGAGVYQNYTTPNFFNLHDW